MIKGISFLRPVAAAAAYEKLSGFFSALGFAPGKGWKEEGERPNDPGSASHPSSGTPDFHPTNKDLFVGTPDFVRPLQHRLRAA